MSCFPFMKNRGGSLGYTYLERKMTDTTARAVPRNAPARTSEGKWSPMITLLTAAPTERRNSSAYRFPFCIVIRAATAKALVACPEGKEDPSSSPRGLFTPERIWEGLGLEFAPLRIEGRRVEVGIA